MKRLLLASVAIVGLGLPAMAADAVPPMPAVAPIAPAVPVATGFNWTGPYVGAFGGYGFGRSTATATGIGTDGGFDENTLGITVPVGAQGLLGGITVGYKLAENMIWRLCWGLGYESGFGNGNILKLPQDRLKDSHFLGANLDLWSTDDTLIQATYAHAFNVTDGFNGTMVLNSNPLTGDTVGAPVIMRYTPSANLGAIHLFGVNASHRARAIDLYGSGNFSATRPTGTTTPFGGLMSDPFESPVNRSGYMFLTGVRYNFPNDERTKLGFEFNHGSQYWFNFAQSADDIIAPKTNTRGNVFETYLTHRINSRFIFKADFIRYLYDYSGSGWHVGAPKALDSTPTLGFPTYRRASMLSVGLITRF